MTKVAFCAIGALICGLGAASAAEVTVAIQALKLGGNAVALGTVSFQDTPRGLKIRPNLSGLTEGAHGFHVHQNASCDAKQKNGRAVPGLAAGGHFDPGKAGKHVGPDGKGHLGDLPVLYVDEKGLATRASVAARLKTSDLKGRAIVIHAGGDNYSDVPARLGGGGARAACGVVVY